METEKRSNRCGGRGPWIAARIGRGIVIGLAFVLVFSFIVQMLWNWLVPGVFGLREITYGQAIGMMVLAKILFGIRPMHGMRPGIAGRWGGHGPWAWGGPCSGGDVANGHIKDWRHYDEWWEAEGRDAFRKFSDNRSK